MVEYLAGVWRHLPLLVAAIVVIAIIWGVRRAVWPRKRIEPPRTVVPLLSPDDPGNLDSSHVGGPLFETTIDRESRRPGSAIK
jgi:hypothetical protein